MIAASRACLASSKARVLVSISEFDMEQVLELAFGLALELALELAAQPKGSSSGIIPNTASV